MRKVALILLFITFAVHSYSQRGKQDVVYLKNGSIIRGELLQSDKNVKLETKDRSIWVFEQSTVDSVKKEGFLRKKLNFSPKGYYNHTSFAILTSYGYGTGVSLKTINGYQYNAQNAIGLGIALESIGRKGFLHSSVDYRHYFSKKSSSFYANGFGGYSMPLIPVWNGSSKFYGGINSGLSGGIRHYFSNHSAIDFSIGFAYQRSMRKELNGWYRGSPFIERKVINNYKRGVIRIGFLFN